MRDQERVSTWVSAQWRGVWPAFRWPGFLIRKRSGLGGDLSVYVLCAVRVIVQSGQCKVRVLAVAWEGIDGAVKGGRSRSFSPMFEMFGMFEWSAFDGTHAHPFHRPIARPLLSSRTQ